MVPKQPPTRLRGLRRAEFRGATVPIAETFASRLLGLALLDRPRAGPGLLIPHCRAVHTFGMRFELDLFFLDADGAVLRIERGVPARRLRRCRAACNVLELPAESDER